MKRNFVLSLILSVLLATSVFAETEKRVDGKRVETYKRITVDTIRGNTTSGIGLDTDRDGSNEVSFDTTGNLLPAVAGVPNLGSEALFFGTANLGTALVFEGATDNAYQTSLLPVDTTLVDKTIYIPDADGTIAVSATSPITLSALGDIGLTLLKDITVSGTGMSGGANDVLPGADADVNIALETSKDIVASGTGMSGGADDVLPGADADVTITLTTSKDLVAGTGLSGGENDVFPGADADVTLSIDQAFTPTWTGAHAFQSAAPQLTLGKDETTPTGNIIGSIKMFGAGDTAFYSTINAGANSANATYTLPTAQPAATYILNMTNAGQMGYDTSVYLTAEVDGIIGNEITNVTGTTLTRSGTGTGIDPYLVALNVGNANSWTAQQDFQNALTVFGKDETGGTPNVAGSLKLFSAGDNAFYSTLTAGTNTANADYILPTAKPAATYLLNMTSGGQMGYDSSVYLTAESDPLALLLDGSKTMAGNILLGANNIVYEGTADEFETTLAFTDPTTPDKTITFPNATGTVAVSASAPATLSATGDIGVTVLKDIVTTAPLAGGANDVLPGADSDLTLSIDNIAYTLLADGTAGNLITWDAAGAPAVVATGNAGQLLTSGGAGAAPTFTNPTKISGMNQHLKFTMVDPATTYTKDTKFVIWLKVDAAITITNLEVSCDADPTTELAGDLKYADAFIGLANPVVINDFDTTNGVRSDSTITSGAVAAGKVIYIAFDASPDALTKSCSFDITYDYD